MYKGTCTVQTYVVQGSTSVPQMVSSKKSSKTKVVVEKFALFTHCIIQKS